MRIGLIIHSLVGGGAERVMTRMANYWAAKGWEVILFTLVDDTVPPFYPLDPRVELRCLGVASRSTQKGEALMRNFWRVRRLRGVLSKDSLDVVISFMMPMNVLAILAMLGTGIPLIISERSDPSQQMISRFWKWLRLLSYGFAGALAVQSERARRYFPWYVRRKSRVIPNPVEVDQAPVGPKPGKLICAMGRLEYQKGFDLLLRAFNRIAGEYPDWQLEIWGEGTRRQNLEELRGILGLQGRVHFPGLTREPYKQLRRSEIFVLSSLYEGFPNVLCEAMACGVPVISFDCPSGPREIIRAGVDGILVPARDVDGLADAIRRLISDPKERRYLAQRAPEVLERFGKEHVMGLWEELIELVLGRGPRKRSARRVVAPS